MTMACCPPAKAEKSAPIEANDIALLCMALGHPARVKLLLHLTGYGACFFGNLSDVTPLVPSTISQQVAILKEAGLVLRSIDDTQVCYCVNTGRLQQFKTLFAAL